jgi:hypothetical protein
MIVQQRQHKADVHRLVGHHIHLCTFPVPDQGLRSYAKLAKLCYICTFKRLSTAISMM